MAIPLLVAGGIAAGTGLAAGLGSRSRRRQLQDVWQGLGPSPGGVGARGEDYGTLGNLYDPFFENWRDARFGAGHLTQSLDEDYYSSRDQADRYRDWMDREYGYPEGGGYGLGQTYSAEEAADINRYPQWQRGMASADDLYDNYLTQDEIAQIMGDPNAAFNYFSDGSDSIYRDLEGYEGLTYDALAEGDRNLRGLGDEYYTGTGDRLAAGSSRVRDAAYNKGLGVREGWGQELRDVATDPNLLESADFMREYRWNPEDQQNLEAQAGTAVGARYRNAINDLEMQAAAQGLTSPMAMAAMRERYEREGAKEAADATTGAKTEGKRLGMDAAMGRERTRLGARQAQAQMELGALSEAEQTRLAAERAKAGIATQAELALLDQNLSSLDKVQNFRAAQERYLNANRLNAYDTQSRLRLGANQFVLDRGAQLRQEGERDTSGRAASIASHRTNTNLANIDTRHRQNLDVEDRAARGAETVANQRLNFERERRGYGTGMFGAYNQSRLTTQGQRTGLQMGRWGAANSAASGLGNYDINRRELQLRLQQGLTGLPTPWESAIQAGAGAFQGARGGRGKGDD